MKKYIVRLSWVCQTKRKDELEKFEKKAGGICATEEQGNNSSSAVQYIYTPPCK